MKKIIQKLTLCLCFMALGRSGYGDVVGYINSAMQPGWNLIANQFLATPDNSLNTILNAGRSQGLQDGTSFTMWNGTAFLPVSYYDSTADSWSINYSLNLGEGGFLTSPNRFTNTFAGTVGPYTDINNAGNNINWTPNYTAGMHLISDPSPIVRNGLGSLFLNVVGRAPVDGEGVAILNPLTQIYSEFFYDSGAGWLNQALNPINPTSVTLGLGLSAWFALGANYSMSIPSPVPEPATIALAGLSSLSLLAMRRKK